MKGIWLKLRQILCSGLMVCVLLCSLGGAHAWAVESWQVYSVEPTGQASIDWDTIVHDAVPTGTYLKLDGTFYYVISSSTSGVPGSWSGPSFYIADLQVCDQQSGTPQTYYDVGTFTDQPLYATLSTSLAGQWVEYYPSWPTGGATNCPSLVQVESAQVDEFSPGQNAAGERIWAEYDRVANTTSVISTVHGTLATATGQYGDLSTSINFDNDVVFTAPGTTTIEGIINNFPITPLSGKFPALNDAGVIVYVVDDINGSDLWSTASQFPLASSTGQITAPDINNNGDVVWAENGEVWNPDTFVFDTVWTIYRLDYGQTVPTPVASASHYMNFPTISDAGEVYWSDQGNLVFSTVGGIVLATSGCVPAMEGWDADFVGNDSLIFIGFEPVSGNSDIYQLALNAPPVSTCYDGFLNQDETGIDCGGTLCAPCGGVTHCSDAVMNYDETGIDCGGLDCAPCGGGGTCYDGFQNQDETGIDCGGTICAPCGGGGTCYDGIQNQDESGIDCGGTICAPCGGVAHCSDTIMNYNETGVDCGGDCDACGVTPYSIVSGAKVDFVGSINDMGEVVWSQFDTETNYQQIYSSIRGRLTDSAVDHWSPSVNNLGDVVWRQSPVCQSVCDAQNSCHEECAPATIHGLVGGDLGFVAMATEGSFPDINPHINSLGEVVWEQFNADTVVGQIFSSSRGKLLEDTARYFRPVLNDVGELIWSQQDGVVLHQSGDPLLTVEVAAGTVSGAFISNNGEIVWSEGPLDDWANLKIYSKTRDQLTFGLPLGSHDAPSVNSCGDVLFSASTYDGMDSLTDLSRLGENAPCFVATEPNEGEAQALSITVGDVKQGALSTQSNVEDWYRFDAPQTETVYIRLNFNADPGNALTVELRNSVGGVLAQLDNASVSPLSPISLTVSATESYYIVARASAGDFGYALSIERDADGDGIRELFDNCPGAANADQIDTDSDGLGDACDDDDDADGVLDFMDNCPLVANADQKDDDTDNIGNACDDDWDNDSVLNAADNCPLVQNTAQLDADADGFGDACDAICVNPQAVVGDGFLVALQADGKVVASSQDDFNPNLGGWVDANGWDNILGIAAGRGHTVAVTYNGTVLGAGASGSGQLDVSSWQDIIAVAAGDGHTVGLKADGTVVAVGHGLFGQLAVESWSDIVAIAAGGYHTVGLKSNGTVLAVGDNADGQTEIGAWTDIVAISAGYNHTVGLKSNGTVVAVGSNSNGQLDVEGWTDIVNLAAGRGETTIGIKSDGTVVAIGNSYLFLLNVGSWSNIVAIAGGSFDNVGIKADGSLVTSRAAWPDSDSWRLGLSRPDLDRDGLPDNCDVCSGDPLGDADGDGVCAQLDSCPLDFDNDADGDGVCGDVDICPGGDDNADADADGLPDFCDTCPDDPFNDTDSDGICAGIGYASPKTGDRDNCPTVANPLQFNFDLDLQGDACDEDDDNDNVPDVSDAFPLNPLEWEDTDNDGIGDNADICPGGDDLADADGDTIPDFCDTCPNDADNDVDEDGVCGDLDNCPNTANATQTDSDGDNIGDACDAPVTTISPAEGSYSAPQPLTLSSDGVTIYYTTDGSQPTTSSAVYSAPFEVSAAMTIVKYFSVSATGVAETINTVIYSIDTSAPVITISSPSSGFVRTDMPQLSFAVDSPESTNVVVKMDGVAIAKVSGNFLSQLSQGEHTLRIEATDNAGNQSAKDVVFTVDSLPPTLTFTQLESPSNLGMQTITGTMEAGAGLNVSENTTATLSVITYPDSTSWQVDVSNLPKDNTTLTFTLTDLAGNITQLTRSIHYNLPPTSTSTSIVTRDNVTSTEVSPTVVDPNIGDSFSVEILSQPAHGTATVVNNKLQVVPEPNYYTTTTADSFTYRVIDPGGLSVSGTASLVINPERPKPVTDVSVVVQPDLSLTITWTPSVSPDAYSYRIYWDAGSGVISYDTPYATVVHPGDSFTTTQLADGRYRFVIRAVDGSGLVEYSSLQYSGRIDTISPEPAQNLLAKLVDGNKVKLTWAASPADDVVRYDVYFDNGSGTIDYGAAPLGSTVGSLLHFTTGALTAGESYRFGVIAEDGNGNRSVAATEATASLVYADLVVSSAIWAPDPIRFGDMVAFTVEIRNDGSVATETPGTWVELALDGKQLTPPDYFSGVIAPGGSLSKNIVRRITNPAQNYTFTVTADLNDALVELDEMNNALSQPLTMVADYLVLTQLDKAAYSAGETVKLVAKVANSSSPTSYFDENSVSLVVELLDESANSVLPLQPLSPVAGKSEFFGVLTLPALLPTGNYTLVVTAEDLAEPQLWSSKSSTLVLPVVEGVNVSVQADPIHYLKQADPVQITGMVQTLEGNPVIDQVVNLTISAKGKALQVVTKTNASGEFVYPFSPGRGAGGLYEVTARAVINQLSKVATTTFTVEGLFILNPSLTLAVTKNSTDNQFQIRLDNVGTETANNITLEIVDLDPTDSVVLTLLNNNITSSLEPGAPMFFDLLASSGLPAPDTAAFDVIVHSSLPDFSWPQLRVNLQLKDGEPIPVAEPNAFTLGVNPDSVITREIVFKNNGYGILHDVVVQAPAFGWVTIADGNIGTLQPGEARSFIVVLRPGWSELGEHQLPLSATAVEFSSPVNMVNATINVNNANRGDIDFLVSNDIGMYVPGATVSLSSYVTYQSTADENGVAAFENVEIGEYDYSVTAAGHTLHAGTISINPGINLPEKRIVLVANYADVRFDVTPTIIEDHYSTNLNMVIQVDLKPIILLSPGRMELSMAEEEVFEGVIKLTCPSETPLHNISLDAYGLRDQGVKLVFVQENGEETSKLGFTSLPPLSELEIPFRARLLAGASLDTRNLGHILAEGQYAYLDPTGAIQIGLSKNSMLVKYLPKLQVDPEKVLSVGTRPTYVDMTKYCFDLRNKSNPTLPDFDLIDQKVKIKNTGNETITLGKVYGITSSISDQTTLKETFGNGLVENGWSSLSGHPQISSLGSVWDGSIVAPNNDPGTIILQPGEEATLYLYPIDPPAINLTLPDNTMKYGAIFFSYATAGRSEIKSIPVYVAQYCTDIVEKPTPSPELYDPFNGETELADAFIDLLTSPCSGCSLPPGFSSEYVPSPVQLPQQDVGELILLQLSQDTSLTREIFTANLAVVPLVADMGSLRADLLIRDKGSQLPALSVFNQQIGSLTGIANVTGTATLAKNDMAGVEWNVIPLSEAGGELEAGREYELAARLSFTLNGINKTIETVWETITVRPDPLLDVHYAMPEEIGFLEPFHVKVAVTNNGFGTAHNFKINSSAPKILFDTTNQSEFYTEASVGPDGLYMPGNREILMGDIPPGQTREGVWIIKSNVEGTLLRFDARMTHENIPGVPLTRLINDPTTELLPVKHKYAKINLKDVHARSLHADPIDTSSGAHVIERQLLAVYGVRPIDVSLSYTSLLTANDIAGRGWGHNHQLRLVEEADATISLRWSANRSNRFVIGGSNSYVSYDKSCRFDTLVRKQDGSFELSRHQDGTIYGFDSEGHLMHQISRVGRTILYSHDAEGRITQVREPISGQKLNLTYEGARLSSVSDLLNRQAELHYDASGDLVSIIDAAGHETRYEYDESGRVLKGEVKELDTVGNAYYITIFVNTYDGSGRVASQDDALPETPLTFFQYDDFSDPDHHITTVTDRNGSQNVMVHDRNYNLLSITDAMGLVTAYLYNRDGKRTQTINPLGKATHYEYDTHGNVTRVTGTSGRSTSMTYDEAGNLLTVSYPNDPDNHVVTSVYDENNRLRTTTNALNETVEYVYDAVGRLIRIIAPSGVTNFAFGSNGLLSTVTDALGNQSRFEYDEVGRRTVSFPPSGGNALLEYDAVDNQIRITDPSGRVTESAYDARHNKVSVASSGGLAGDYQTTFTYNGNNLLTSTTNALGETSRFEYDHEGRPVTTTNARNFTTTLVYDEAGRLLRVNDPTTDPGQNFSEFIYDELGNVIEQKDAYGVTIATSEYDYDLGSYTLTRQGDAFSNQLSYDYDGLDRITKVTDPLNREYSFEYDALNRLLNVSAPEGVSAGMLYGNDGNRSEQTDPNGNRTSFEFDGISRPSKIQTEAGVINTKAYEDERLKEVVDGRGNKTTFSYNADGSLQSATDSMGTTAYHYDIEGQLDQITENGVTISYQYDELGRIVRYTDVFGNLMQYDYDSVGNLERLVYPDGRAVRYVYDGADRMVSVTDWAERTTQYEYDKNGRLTLTLRPDGSKELRDYDEAGRLVQLKDVKVDNVTLISQFDFSYDAAGNVLGEDVLGLAEPLVLVNAVSMAYNADNRLVNYGGSAVGYDGEGNMVNGPLVGGMQVFVYDARNRLQSVGGSTYGYDANGNRISHTRDSVTTRYAINPVASLSQLLVEQADNGAGQTYYVYGLGLLGLEDATDGSYVNYHYDRRGSTVALTDMSGAVTDGYLYSPFGEEVQHSPGSSPQPFRYNGRDGVMNDDNGLYYMRARYYNPEIKRFVNVDPLLGSIQAPQSLNRYAYLGGQVIDHVDPSGLSPDKDMPYLYEWTGTKYNRAYNAGSELVAYKYNQVADNLNILMNLDDYLFKEAYEMNSACSARAVAIDGGASCGSARSARNAKMIEVGDKGVALTIEAYGLVGGPAGSILANGVYGPMYDMSKFGRADISKQEALSGITNRLGPNLVNDLGVASIESIVKSRNTRIQVMGNRVGTAHFEMHQRAKWVNETIERHSLPIASSSDEWFKSTLGKPVQLRLPFTFDLRFFQ